MAKRYWVKEAFSKNKGALHRDLGVPQGKKIPESALKRAANMKRKSKTKKRAVLAETARHFKH